MYYKEEQHWLKKNAYNMLVHTKEKEKKKNELEWNRTEMNQICYNIFTCFYGLFIPENGYVLQDENQLIVWL